VQYETNDMKHPGQQQADWMFVLAMRFCLLIPI